MNNTPNFNMKIKAILDATKHGERVCEMTGERWEVTEIDIERWRRFNVPPMKVSPKTYFKLMGQLLTGYSWWWNTDVESGKPILSHIHPHTPWLVMDDEAWHQKDFSEIASNADMSRPIFDQLYDLAMRVPMSARKNIERPINSIARISLGDENSYFVEGCRSKRSFYCSDSIDLEDCAEVCWSMRVRESYNVMMSFDLHRCRVARNSRNSFNCDFIFDCWNCESCFMTFNCRRAKYLWDGEQLSEGEWKKRHAGLDLGDRDIFKRLYTDFLHRLGTEAIWPENFNLKAENSSGEYLNNCVNCQNCWYSEGAKDCSWSVWANLGTEDCVLGCHPGSAHCYGDMIAIHSNDCRFCWVVQQCQRCEYCIECFDCEDCFGCVGLKRKRFHLFNKAYSESDYRKNLNEIKCAMLDRGEYGMPLYGRFAQGPFAYSGGSFFLDDKPQEREQLGIVDFETGLDGAFGNWEGKHLLSPSEIPSRLEDADRVKGKAFLDPKLNRPFTLFPAEIDLYKKLGVRVPRWHFTSRVEDIWREMNLFDFELRMCAKCAVPITVAKNKTFPKRKIYCRSCYLAYLQSRS